MASKPCPMPLFNWRKRQRQALVSDPQSMPTHSAMPSKPTTSTQKFSTSNYTGGAADDQNDDDNLMEMLDDQSTFEDVTMGNNQNGLQQMNQPRTNSERCGQDLPNPSSYLTRPTAQTSASNSRPALRGGTTGNNFTFSKSQFSKGSALQRNNQSYGCSDRESNQNSSRQPISRGGRRGGINTSTTSTTGSGVNRAGFQNRPTFSNKSQVVNVTSNELTGISSSSSSSFFGPPSSSSARNTQSIGRARSSREMQGYHGNSSVNRPGSVAGSQLKVQSGFGVQKSSFASRGKASHAGMNQGNGNTQMSNNCVASIVRNDQAPYGRSNSVRNTGGVNTSKPGVTPKENSLSTKFTSQKPDTSMHFFTCPINILRSWSSARLFEGLIMFEVYGKVISATLSDKTGTGKEFVIQDDSSSIKCIFYEIDRPLPTLMRGQIHRVVGAFERTRGVLKVISVRKAAKTERSVFLEAFQNTMEEMQSLGFPVNEP